MNPNPKAVQLDMLIVDRLNEAIRALDVAEKYAEAACQHDLRREIHTALRNMRIELDMFVNQ